MILYARPKNLLFDSNIGELALAFIFIPQSSKWRSGWPWERSTAVWMLIC